MLYRRLVVKLGTSLLTGGSDSLNPAVISSLVDQIARLHQQGAEVVVVSSGAIAAGRQRLKLTQEKKDIPFKQVLAAIGQSYLMFTYEQLFSWYGITIAQALLTREDFSHRLRYLNARNTLLSLLEHSVVPIINENDVVAVEELEGFTFGDNDNLSALVANLIDADILIILTTAPGLYTADPRKDPHAQLISRVEKITPEIERLAEDTLDPYGVGGMKTKIQAAELSTASGIPVVIANGREREVLIRLISGEQIGTHFSPTSGRLESRRRWLLSAPIKGKVYIDYGAQAALCEHHKSLLPVGVIKVEGEFKRGDVLAIYVNDKLLAYGQVNYSSWEIELIKGHHSQEIISILGYEYGEEVVHRNNMVLI